LGYKFRRKIYWCEKWYDPALALLGEVSKLLSRLYGGLAEEIWKEVFVIDDSEALMVSSGRFEPLIQVERLEFRILEDWRSAHQNIE
jgi:hypothetical protein